MKYFFLIAVAVAIVWLVSWQAKEKSASLSAPASASPVLVELFTSEGCSSCPPADALLQKLDGSSSNLIVMSEHVDYWNQLGWKDPYSAHFFSERQSGYARHFGLDSVYTPQMVIDGAREFVGSDREQTERAVATAREAQKVAVRITSTSAEANDVRVGVEVDGLPPEAKPAEVFVALALDHAESQVARGENAGHKLTHISVVRSITRAGVADGKPFSQEVRVPLDGAQGSGNLRVIAFLQESGQGRVLGAVLRHLSVNVAAVN